MCRDVKCPNIAARKKRSLITRLVLNLLGRFRYVSVNERILLVLHALLCIVDDQPRVNYAMRCKGRYQEVLTP